MALRAMLLLAFFGAVYAQTQPEPPISDIDGMELQALFGKFPKINATVNLEGGICEICGCITTFCRTDGNFSYVTTLGLGDGGCRGYIDCPKDSFDVVLEESDWPEFEYLTEFRVTNGLGTGVELLRGSLPEKLPEISPYLQFIQVVGTALQGSIPSTWFETGVWQYLRSFQLTSNPNLQGQLPDFADESFPNLVSFTVEDSPIGGTIPSIGKRTIRGSQESQPTISFVNLGLTGTLPADFAVAGGLGTLDLTNNSLTGTLPASWGDEDRFGRLAAVLLANSSLTGTVPESWSRLLRTTGDNGALTLDFAGNKLEGSIPAAFGTSGRKFANTLFVQPGNTFCGPAPNNTLLLFEQGNDFYNTEFNATLSAC